MTEGIKEFLSGDHVPSRRQTLTRWTEDECSTIPIIVVMVEVDLNSAVVVFLLKRWRRYCMAYIRMVWSPSWIIFFALWREVLQKTSQQAVKVRYSKKTLFTFWISWCRITMIIIFFCQNTPQFVVIIGTNTRTNTEKFLRSDWSRTSVCSLCRRHRC